jgi:hypothetical protein
VVLQSGAPPPNGRAPVRIVSAFADRGIERANDYSLEFGADNEKWTPFDPAYVDTSQTLGEATFAEMCLSLNWIFQDELLRDISHNERNFDWGGILFSLDRERPFDRGTPLANDWDGRRYLPEYLMSLRPSFRKTRTLRNFWWQIPVNNEIFMRVSWVACVPSASLTYSKECMRLLLPEPDRDGSQSSLFRKVLRAESDFPHSRYVWPMHDVLCSDSDGRRRRELRLFVST